MPANGELSEKSGVYKTLCCDAEIVIGVGIAFPDCPNHANLPTKWKELPDVDPMPANSSRKECLRTRTDEPDVTI